MANPGLLSAPANIFISGNDHIAKDTVKKIMLKFGWSDVNIHDLGSIESAQGAESLILFMPYLMKTKGIVPFALTAIF